MMKLRDPKAAEKATLDRHFGVKLPLLSDHSLAFAGGGTPSQIEALIPKKVLRITKAHIESIAPGVDRSPRETRLLQARIIECVYHAFFKNGSDLREIARGLELTADASTEQGRHDLAYELRGIAQELRDFSDFQSKIKQKKV